MSNQTKTESEEFNISAILGQEAKKETPLERQLATITPEDAAATTVEDVKFQFRDLLAEDERKALELNAPKFAEAMIADHNVVINFGGAVLEKLNRTGTELLEAQKDIEIPGAEEIVNNLLREIDGFSAKYKNAKIESTVSKIKKFFNSSAYTLKTMVRETKPITDKINLAETSMAQMERKLAENVAASQILHKNTLETIEEVVQVLAALEEITEHVRKEFKEVDTLLANAEGSPTEVTSVNWKGDDMTVNALKEVHADLASGISELDKTWFAWRQQFFLGYAQAPSVRNLGVVSMSMQRRCQEFRTMALPAARSALAMWQQAVLADEAATMGNSVNEATNKLVQSAFSETAAIVDKVAKAAEAPNISADTILVITQSIHDQCDSMINASKQGQANRQSILTVMSDSEKAINTKVTESRREHVRNAIANASGAGLVDMGERSPDLLEVLKSKK